MALGLRQNIRNSRIVFSFMRKRKTTIIFIISVLLIALGFFGLSFFRKPISEKPEKTLPKETEKAPQLSVEELKKKLLKNAKPSPAGPDDLIIIESEKKGSYERPSFEITYQKPFDLFLISLYDKPLAEVRKEAENALLEKAEGQLDTLCQLNVLLGSPRFVSGGEILKNPESLNICLRR